MEGDPCHSEDKRLSSSSCIWRLLGHVDEACSLTNSCRFKLPALPRDYTLRCSNFGFLRVKYECILPTSTKQLCGLLSPRSGKIVFSNSCRDKPTWKVTAKPGQRINLSLLDFTQKKRPFCLQVTEVKRKRIVCSKRFRRQNFYESTSNSLTIEPSTQTSQLSKYMLEYRIEGCPDIKLPKGMWQKRKENRLYYGCSNSKKSWTIHCRNNFEWSGTIHNCSTKPLASE